MDVKSAWSQPVGVLTPAYTLRYTFGLIMEIPPNPYLSEWIHPAAFTNVDGGALVHAIGFKVVWAWWSDYRISTQINYVAVDGGTGGVLSLGLSTGVSGCLQSGAGRTIQILPAFHALRIQHNYQDLLGNDITGEGVFTLYARVR